VNLRDAVSSSLMTVPEWDKKLSFGLYSAIFFLYAVSTPPARVTPIVPRLICYEFLLTIFLVNSLASRMHPIIQCFPPPPLLHVFFISFSHWFDSPFGRAI